MKQKRVPMKGSRVKSKDSKSGDKNVDDMIMNIGGGDASGLFQFDPFGFPQNQQFPGSAPVENVNTIFKNLRWYLVSNFKQVLNQLYAEVGLCATIVDVPCDDAYRGGVEIKSKQLDENQIQQLQISLDRDEDLVHCCQTNKWDRLFGGAGLIVLVGDQDPEEPLNLGAIGPDTSLEFRPADLWELFWTAQNPDGYDPTLQFQEFEYFDYYGKKLHRSRVMELRGVMAPSFIRPRLRNWGLSVVEILVRSMNQYLKSTDLIFEVLDEFKVDVYKIKNLVNLLMSPGGKQAVLQQIRQSNLLKNFQNALVMDAEDDWDHKQLNFAGLAETLAGIRMQVAADMRMPITKLFGTSASGGIGNTDQNDMENYNSMVESQVRSKAKYMVLRVCEIKCQKLFGLIPTDLSVAFKPLRVLSAEQEENVKTQKFNRLIAAKTAGEISTLEFRDACNKGNLFDVTLDTSEDLLNPDDPQMADIVQEGTQDPKKEEDSENPGLGRSDTKTPKTLDMGAVPKNPVKELAKNSSAFDLVSYEADGGDQRFDSRRRLFFENPKDPSLWKQCEQETFTLYGGEHFAFTFWLYQKRGGQF